MNTDKSSTHQHSLRGTPTTSTGVHSHSLAAVDAAIAALDTRLDKLEATMGDVVLRITKLEAPPVTPPAPPPVEPPPTPPGPAPADLAAAIAATPVGATLDAQGGTYAGPITLNKAITLRNATITSSAKTGTYSSGTVIITAAATLSACKVQGGFVGVYVHAIGASVIGCTITNVVYAGIAGVSAVDCLFRGNRVSGVRPVSDVNSYNSYGIYLGATSAPVSTRCIVEDNVVENIPLWHGLDSHGSLDSVFRRNTVRACRRGLMLTLSDTSVATTNVLVENNDFTAPTAAQIAAAVAAYPAATPSAMARDFRGIYVAGGSGQIINNVGHGYGPSGDDGAWWTVYAPGSYVTTGNSPAIP